jgi:hypothetical protein
VWVTQYGRDQLREQDVSQNRDEGEQQEQYDVDDEEDLRDDVEPVSVVGELVDHDGCHSCAHGDDEPSTDISPKFVYRAVPRFALTMV